MKHFVLFYDYCDDYVQRRAAFRQEHLALARASAARDELQLGGALMDEPAALLVFRAESQAVVERFVAADPYVLHGVVIAYRIRGWTTVVGRDACEPLP